MRTTHPEVRLIAYPKINWTAVEDYMRKVGGLPWLNRIVGDGPSDAEVLVEYAGRRCYRSWAPGLNANVTKVREDSAEYLTNILRSKHGAVLEHAQFTFDFDEVSRVFTHELVRHRAGVAISQESLRYVRLTDLGFRIPDVLAEKDGMEDRIVSLVETLEEFQRDAAEAYGLDDDGVPFHVKKEVTSALRRLAPIGLSTGMVWSANLRTLRHVIAQRTAPGAEEEIRLVFGQVAEIMQKACPLLFGDFTKNDDGAWIPGWEKV